LLQKVTTNFFIDPDPHFFNDRIPGYGFCQRSDSDPVQNRLELPLSFELSVNMYFKLFSYILAGLAGLLVLLNLGLSGLYKLLLLFILTGFTRIPAVLRIRDVYPGSGSRIRPFLSSRIRIPDPT
jgi:hypothetical protein